MNYKKFLLSLASGLLISLLNYPFYQLYLGRDSVEQENAQKFKNWLIINTLAIDLAIVQYFLLYKHLISDSIWIPTTLPRFILFLLSLPIYVVLSYSFTVIQNFKSSGKLAVPIFTLLFSLTLLNIYCTFVAFTAIKVLNGPSTLSLQKRTIMWIYAVPLTLIIAYFGIDATVSSYGASVSTSIWCAVTTFYTIVAMIMLITSMEDLDIQGIWNFGIMNSVSRSKFLFITLGIILRQIGNPVDTDVISRGKLPGEYAIIMLFRLLEWTTNPFGYLALGYYILLKLRHYGLFTEAGIPPILKHKVHKITLKKADNMAVHTDKSAQESTENKNDDSQELTGKDQVFADECSVCWVGYEEEETVLMVEGCNHVFHSACLRHWVEKHASCPLCRALLETDWSE